ncbi:MAG: glycoside hydrolase/phage tail family protein [Alphaproteobacteria bacterium]|nr:glycoside hydrolase/phage tail family protein [Alphaproteobacteria bacterium]
MATVVLQYAGAALGTLLGGPLGGVIGRALGGLAGAELDQALFGGGQNREGPRLSSLQVMASEEGAPIPVTYGRMRIAGQVIWATNLLEVASTSAAGGKGLPAGPTTTSYSYFANFAVGLCEGPITGLGRAWADGKEIDLETLSPRIYLGSETQTPDSLISATQGSANAPAYRGLAYVVFERLPLANFGNRLPQLSFEVFAKGNDVADLVQAVNVIPGATEFGYDTTLITRNAGPGVTQSENTHASASRSDWSVSMDQLQASCSNVAMASLVVAWFGTDLRCGQCQLLPGVESASKVTTGAAWQVGGLSRSGAHVVSQVNGQAAYGGTPSDASVLHAIADLKARGLKVMVNPFILMDIPAGNALPDPYGGAAQAGFPWRGRITASKAPGVAGSPDKTAAAAAELASFIGTALPSHFTAGADTVLYSGPAEWSYRRMILHHAKLCALAGGVDAFLIGSELRGLTTLRSAAGTYPFVAALQALAADVKAILPGAKVSYAADWSEYFGHQPQDGSHDIYFHLDPLWASPAIDFIGIDNYAPLSDWRDGTAHLDVQAGAASIYDQAYLQSRVLGGEGYDWFYASAADRTAQIRTPIADGAYGKPWVFRPKDVKGWWANAHVNRPGGVEAAAATGWVPQSKPIWFTELGCPAIDKGTNQPNQFFDAKSSESGWPYFSGGQQDDQIQQAYINAVAGFWSGTQNPVSAVYGAPMLDTSRLFHWCWDARPYPAFPGRTDVWGDAANYARGHWLNGRIGGVDLGHLIAALAARFGFTAVDVGAVEGQVDGFVLDRPMSARDALETLLQAFATDAVESSGLLKFTSRRRARPLLLAPSDLVEDEKGAAIISRQRAQETDLPVALHVGYLKSGLDYRQAAVAQQRGGTSGKKEISLALAAALAQPAAQQRADVLLAESWAARETASFTLPPHLAAVEPGDVLSADGALWRVKTLTAGTARKVEALAHDPACYDPPPAPLRGVSSAAPAVFGPADAVIMDLATAITGQAAPWIAAQASPWPGNLALFRQTGNASFTLNTLLPQQATLARSLTALAAGLTDRIDYTQTLDVQMRSGALSSVSTEQLLNGANLAALGNADTGFELLQFQNAILVGANVYRLSGLLRAQAGSGPEMLAARAAGQDFVQLNAAVRQAVMTTAEAGQGASWRLGPPQLDYGSAAYLALQSPATLKALRPLAPAQIKLARDPAGLLISWIRRTRINGDSWELAEVPLGEDVESYQLTILAGGVVKRSLATSQPVYLYASADIAADFGAMPASLTLRVAQVSAAYGAGAILERTVNV